MKYIERFTVAVAVVVLIGTLALVNDRSARPPAPATRLRPEQVATLPARIQAQVAGTAPVTAGGSLAVPSSVRRLRPEQVLALPLRIQEQVAGTAVQPAQALAPEDLLALPPQIHEQVRGTAQGVTR